MLDYVGHWRGEAWATRHSCDPNGKYLWDREFVMVHNSEADALRWTENPHYPAMDITREDFDAHNTAGPEWAHRKQDATS